MLIFLSFICMNIDDIQGGPKKMTPLPAILLTFQPNVRIFKIKFQLLEGNL